MKVAHLSAEVSPFAQTGGLGDVVGSLPKALAALGHDVTVWMPLYRRVWRSLARLGIHPQWVTDPFHIELGYRSHEVGLLSARLPGTSVPVFFVGSDPHFDREDIYGPGPGGKDDGLQRYAVFVRAVLQAMRRLDLVPDVLHAHDWHATLAPMALRWDWPRDPRFQETATIQTVHNMAYQGMYHPDEYIHLGLPREAYGQLEWHGLLNLMKGGLLAADAVTAVSPTFAHEISTPEGGFGLDPIVRYRQGDLHGIVNGIDTQTWDPSVDPKIPFNYDARRLRRKWENRRALLSMAGMDKNDGSLVVGLVGRLTHQKGVDLLFPVLGDLMSRGVRFVALGSGDEDLERRMFEASGRARGRFWGYVGFNEELAHLIEAGTDAFLMPSRFEPCGLNQMYSLAYGTPPIVRRVGGLADTVRGYDGGNASSATGFSFDAPHPIALRETVSWAQHCWRDPRLWTTLVRNGMQMARDFSWERSAQRYVGVYAHVRARRGLPVA